VPGEAALETGSWFFGCSACGKCCNSPPQLFLPELFRYEQRFIGCLGVSRAAAALELCVHAFGFGSQRACPALAGDGRCSLHEIGKPQVCSVVPLHGSLPDAEQHAVLGARRGEAQFWGAGCIAAEPAPRLRELTRRLQVVDPDAQAALAAYRRGLALEQRFWVSDVTRLLEPELARSGLTRSLPESTLLVLSLVPTLALLADTSARCRERVLGFVAAQDGLMVEQIAAALLRRKPEDRADTALLRRLLAQNRALHRVLLQRPPQGRALDTEHAAAVESWLCA
jgi:Fe-S-cluster containining protein